MRVREESEGTEEREVGEKVGERAGMRPCESVRFGKDLNAPGIFYFNKLFHTYLIILVFC